MKHKLRSLPKFACDFCLALAVLFACFSCRVHHHPDSLFSSEDMQKDLYWLQTKVLDYHPACIDSLRFDSVATAFQMAYYEATKPMNELQFLRSLRITLNTLRCGHTTAVPSKSFYRYYRTAKPKPLFPIQVYAREPGLYVRYNGSNDTTISPGDQILSINQASVSAIKEGIAEFLPADGYHNSFKSYHLSLNFPTYYLFLKGPNYSYEAGMVDSMGRYSSHIFALRSQGRSTTRQLPMKSTKILKSDNYRALGRLISNSKIGYLRVYAFGGSSSWYEKAFSEIEKKGYDHLILDLRGNSGGNLFNANELLTYLLEDTFSLRFEREKKRIRFNGNSDFNYGQRFAMNLFDWMPSKTKKAGGSTCERVGEKRIYRFRFEPKKKHHFRGKMVVLMDGGTFSASSLVAAMLRKKMQIPLVGEESGGAASGSFAMMMPTLTLPRTKMRVTLPLFHLNHEMGPVPFRGLLPDLKLEPNISLKIKGIDSDLEYLARHPELFQ